MLSSYKKLPPRTVLFILFVICAFVAGTAYIMENYFGVLACQMCHYERDIFIVAGTVALISLLLPGKNLHSFTIVLLGAAFLAGAVFAGYHVAIQQHWANAPAFCTSNQPDLLTAIIQPFAAAPTAQCDQVTGQLFGFSLALYNAVLSFILAMICWIWALSGKSGNGKSRVKAKAKK